VQDLVAVFTNRSKVVTKQLLSLVTTTCRGGVRQEKGFRLLTDSSDLSVRSVNAVFWGVYVCSGVSNPRPIGSHRGLQSLDLRTLSACDKQPGVYS
jgi:hypothetical protein